MQAVMSNPWVRAAAVALGVVAFAFLCYLLSPVLVPLLLAFLVAYVLDPVLDLLEGRRISRSAAIAGLGIVALFVVLAIPVFLIPNLIAQADRLIQAARAAGSGAVTTWVDHLLNRLPLDELVRYLGWAAPDAQDVDPRAVLAEHIGTYVKDNALQLLRSYAPQMAGAGQWAGATAAQVLTSLGRGALAFAVFLGNLVVFAFVTGYLLNDFDQITNAAKGLVPPKHRPRIFDIVRKIDAQIHGFLRGQMLVCLCLGIMYTLGLLISGTPFAVLIGVFGGMASFVPYLGVTLTILPSLLLSLLQHGADWHIIGVIATFAIAHAIEGTVLTPKIVGDQVGLSPVWVILAIMVFGSLLGFLGLLLAVPLAAALKVLVLEAVAHYKGSSLFGPEGGSGGDGSPGSSS